MFWLILVLLFFGIFLILLEVYAPYGLSLICGLCVIGYSCYLCYTQPGVSSELATVYLVGALAVSAGAAYYAVRTGMKFLTLKDGKIDKGQLPDGQDRSQRPGLNEVVEVVQPLHPTGTVLWDGNRLPARTLKVEMESKSGEKVVVKGSDAIYLLVEPVEKSD